MSYANNTMLQPFCTYKATDRYKFTPQLMIYSLVKRKTEATYDLEITPDPFSMQGFGTLG